MKNIEMRVDKGILTIEVDLSKSFGKSASGKTTIVASTEGNIAVGEGEQAAIVGLNVYKK